MRTLIASIVILLSGLLAQPVMAAADGDPPAHHHRHHNGELSPSAAARIAQRQDGGGRVLSVERVEGGYRVKLLKKGDVRSVMVPNPGANAADAIPVLPE